MLFVESLSYEWKPVSIQDRVKVEIHSDFIWESLVDDHPIEEATWETKPQMHNKHSQLFMELGIPSILTFLSL